MRHLSADSERGTRFTSSASRVFAALGLLALLVWAAAGCSSSTGPSGPVFSDYHFSQVGSKRYYQETRLIDTFVIDTFVDTLPEPDTLIIDILPTVDTLVDTLLDSLWRVYTETDGVYWAQSVVKPTSALAALRYQIAPASPDDAVARRVGLLADTIFVDPSLRDKVLRGPLEAGRTWAVRSDGTITARLVGEETLDLPIGSTTAWHVNMGALSDEWWAPGLGRVQYDEFDRDGIRVRGVLIAVGHL